MSRPTLEEVEWMVHELDYPVLPEVVAALQALNGTKAWPDVFDAIRTAKESVANLELEAVRLARFDDESWDAIGQYLGISGPGARKRYASTGRSDLDELDALEELHDAERRAFLSEANREVARVRSRLRQGGTGAEDAERQAQEQVWMGGGYWDKLMRLIRDHSRQHMELVRRLEDAVSDPKNQ